jgi:hypothetical protein
MAGILEKLLRPQKRTTYRSIKVLELESAKEILAEVFHVQPSVVDDMIQRRLEDRGPAIEEGRLSEDGLWPATFCLVSSYGPGDPKA